MARRQQAAATDAQARPLCGPTMTGRDNECHDGDSASHDANSPGQAVMIPVTGSQYQIGAGPYSAVVTELGAGLRELTHGGEHVIASYKPHDLPPGGAGEVRAGGGGVAERDGGGALLGGGRGLPARPE